jgi:hypothetical protein
MARKDFNSKELILKIEDVLVRLNQFFLKKKLEKKSSSVCGCKLSLKNMLLFIFLHFVLNYFKLIKNDCFQG